MNTRSKRHMTDVTVGLFAAIALRGFAKCKVAKRLVDLGAVPGHHLTVRFCSDEFELVQISQQKQTYLASSRSSAFAREPGQPPTLLVLLLVSADLLRRRYQHMALTDIAIRNAKAAEKPKKLGDSGGLHLLVTPAGGKLWRVSYRFGRQAKDRLFRSVSRGVLSRGTGTTVGD